jgi:hypothetical protein
MKPSLRGLLLSSLFLSACGAREEGMRLHLQLVHAPARGAEVDGPTRGFTTPRGEHITLTRAHVTLHSLELFPCQEAGSVTAWHTASSPLKLGTPHVDGLERPDGAPLELGTLRPPPGTYCRMRLVFAPADADAVGAPAGGDMLGRTLRLEGDVTPAEGGPARPFLLQSTGTSTAERALDRLSLSEEEREKHLVLSLPYDRWLEDVPWDSQEAAAQVLTQVSTSVQLQPEP